MIPKNVEHHDLSSAATNYTTSGYQTINEGFSGSNPSVGTTIHQFKFKDDPWSIVSENGVTLVVLSDITMTIAKVFNPNNTTDSFWGLSWTPNYSYHSADSNGPSITIGFKDVNSVVVFEASTGPLDYLCGVNPVKSRTGIANATVFDVIASGTFTLGPYTWQAC